MTKDRMLHLIAAIAVLSLVPIATIGLGPAFAQPSSVIITEQTSFTDSLGRQVVVGTIKNNGTMPEQIMMAVKTNAGGSVPVVENLTFGSIVWPQTESPFKLVLGDGVSPSGVAFVKDVQRKDISQFDSLILNYSNMGVGTTKSLVGTITNRGPFDIQNVSVFASVHDSTGAQIDTVRSNVIPLLRAGETLDFKATPDSTIKNKVLFYSCAGLDVRDPIETLNLGGGQFVAFQLQGASKVQGFRYDNATDSITMNVIPYGPSGQTMTMKLPQTNANKTLSVIMDGHSSNHTAITSDGRTITVNVFVPPGSHDLSIQGIKTIPELKNSIFTLVAAMGSVLFVLISLRRRRKTLQ